MQANKSSSQILSSTAFKDALKCGICMDLAIEPVETSCCHILYCNPCILGHQAEQGSCPECGVEGYKLFSSHIARKIISIYPINCPFDCGTELPRSSLDAHKKQCRNRVYECSADKCTFKGKHDEYSTHITQAHIKDIVLAFDELNTRTKFTQSGKISGHYRYNNQEYPVQGTYKMYNRTITIRTSDQEGNATWSGKVDVNNLLVELVKQYETHAIIYNGKFDTKLTCMIGRWGWGGQSQDTFELLFERASSI